MPFESLSFRYTFHFPDIPHRWLPLIYLYDPDLPLFPLFYFHVLRNNIPAGTRPRLADRAFGYVEHVRLQDPGVDVEIVVNKNLSIAGSEVFAVPVERELRERFGPKAFRADLFTREWIRKSGTSNLGNRTGAQGSLVYV